MQERVGEEYVTTRPAKIPVGHVKSGWFHKNRRESETITVGRWKPTGIRRIFPVSLVEPSGKQYGRQEQVWIPVGFSKPIGT